MFPKGDMVGLLAAPGCNSELLVCRSDATVDKFQEQCLRC